MIKVLIAEDNAVNRELLRELLEGRGYMVLEACDGQEALQMIEEAQPELLLMDIGMPVLDGFAVIRRIREDPRLAPLPVVAVTAYAMRGDREKILESGFDGYLSKPLNPLSLTAELDRLLIKSRHPADPNQITPDQINPDQINPDRIKKDRPASKARSARATGGT